MHVLLVYTNRNRSILSPPPIGLAYVAKPLRAKGHEVQLLNLMHLPDPQEAMRRALAAFRPEVAGFSVRNLDNQDMLHPACPLAEIREFVQIAKQQSVVSVLGGTAFSTLPEEMFRFMEADYGVAGQGEVSMARLVDSLAAGAVDRTIPGLVWAEEGEIRRNPNPPTGYAGVEADWSILDFRPYRRTVLPVAVILKTGCPHQCIYCDAPASQGSRYVLRSPEEIVADMQAVVRLHGIRTIFLNDPSFGATAEHSKAVLDAIIRADLGLRLMSLLVPVRGEFDDEFFSMFRRAGGRLMILGVEVLSPKMLENYRKPFQLDDALSAGAAAVRHGIRLGVTALFGGPGENETTIRESVAALKGLSYSLLSYAIGIRVLPDTGLLDVAIAEGQVEKRSELLMPKFYVSRELDVAWADRYLHSHVRRYGYRQLRMARLGIGTMLSNYWHTHAPRR